MVNLALYSGPGPVVLWPDWALLSLVTLRLQLSFCFFLRRNFEVHRSGAWAQFDGLVVPVTVGGSLFDFAHGQNVSDAVNVARGVVPLEIPAGKKNAEL